MRENPLSPVENGRDDRDSAGRFLPGNGAAKGRGPSEAARIRQLIREAVSDDDVRGIVAGLVAEAKAGNIQAARELLDRLAGKPKPLDDDGGDTDNIITVTYAGEGRQWTRPGEARIDLTFDKGG